MHLALLALSFFSALAFTSFAQTPPTGPTPVDANITTTVRPLGTDASDGSSRSEPPAVRDDRPVEPGKQPLPKWAAYTPRPEPTPAKTTGERFHWKPAIAQSLAFLALQQGYRMAIEEKTQRELKGPFFHDWFVSVSHLKGWDDGGRFFTNYMAHPTQGSITNRIFINNSDNAKRQVFGSSKAYWRSRFKAMAWTAIWSAQFELGPISETSIGNVGKDLLPNGRSKETYEDLFNTPVLGFGVTVAEDALDRYILAEWLEKRGRHRAAVKMLRTVLTPTLTFTNVLRLRVPWYRDNR
ncbi:MAG: hypothetical protein JO314_08815 [Acidobacteria bacterium]|nr:hypothetical protein [Acidobacteriota bacterium]